MRLTVGTLVCLSCIACSHQQRTAEDGSSAAAAEQREVASGPAPAEMRPASLESAPASDRDASALPESESTRPATPPPVSTPAVAPPPASTPAATPPPATTPPDNTKVNQRDRDGATSTPLDQGNSEADLKLTQHIRQAVMADDSLSFTAKNVKIITRDGKVTLRGPVKTEHERNAIEAAARKVAGAAAIDNQIEVKK